MNLSIPTGDIYAIKAVALLSGDPLDPSSTDILALNGTLDVGKPVPQDWIVLSGNMNFSTVYTVAYRYACEGL